MKIYGNKNNLERIQRKEKKLQEKIYKEEDDKIKEPFFYVMTVILVGAFLLWKYTKLFEPIINFFSD